MAANLTLLQKRVVNVINRVITSGKIANAYIFAGGEGVGKKRLAKAFVKSVNCEQPLGKLNDECNCRFCVSIEKGTSTDFIDIYPDGTKIKVSQIRDLKDITKYGPNANKWMFIVINEAEKMTQEASNSFLKLLEEPAPNVCFILIVKNVDSVLNTIRSRSQLVAFSQLNPDYLTKTLDNPDVNLINIVKGEKNIYEFVIDDSVRPLIEQIDNINKSSDKYKLMLLAEKISAYSKDEVKYFINYIMMRMIVEISQCGDINLIGDKIEIIKNCHESFKKIDYNIALKLHIESLLLKLAAVG